MWEYFTDSILRGPTIGSMLMCLAASLIGVIIILQKQSLIGEALSHASYPGVMLGVILAGFLSFNLSNDIAVTFLIMIGAFSTALLSLWMIAFLQKKMKISSDAALCFILSSFFGIGVLLASHLQFTHSSLYKKGQTYLYGQAATMTDIHIWIYGTLSFLIILSLIFLYKEINLIIFNQEYARSLGVPVKRINLLLFILTVLAVIIGIRSVGVVLMSAMFIAPAVAARQFSNKLPWIFFLSGFFGLLSGFLGNYFSVEIPQAMYMLKNSRFSLPTGPMIILVATFICLLSLLFAPERGLLLRLIRASYFKHQCLSENLLKCIWRFGPNQEVSLEQILQYQNISSIYLYLILLKLSWNGWLERTSSGSYRLTSDGNKRASHIVRLHRLWEVYLADYIGVGAERVHRNAEEMEHILTPEIEQELTFLLKDPQVDPHHQRIPPKEGL